MARNSVEQIDKDEKKIFRMLESNAKQSIDDIANACGFSRQKVWRIMKHFEDKKMIWGYTAISGGEKLEVSSFVILIKRSCKPTTENLIKKITTRSLVHEAAKLSVTVENSIFTHGEYDWILTINAKGLREAKLFYQLLLKEFEGFIQVSTLLEIMTASIKQNIPNPQLKEELISFI